MKMRKTVVFAFAGIMSAAAFATDWYVDANNGNDSWDGTTADIPSQEVIDQCTAQSVPVPGPRKTLHAMMSDERVQPDDVVKAAEGDYNEGGDVYESNVTSNRVQVKAGVTLLATGSRDATFITGSGGSYPDGYTNGAVRCVYFLEPPAKVEYGYGIVKGFTLRDGRTGSASEHGGASAQPGLLVECDLQGNGCGNSTRGGTMWKGTALRCRFSSYDRGYLGFSTTKIIDSLVASSQSFYSSCTAYNCTFSGNGYFRAPGTTYNCFFIGSGAASGYQDGVAHKNTFSRSNFHQTDCTTDDVCRVVTAEETPYDATTFRPLAGSVAIDAGDMSHYAAATNGWKAAWLAECGKDYYGNDRVVNGAIDVGCGEAQEESILTISDDSDGLVVTGAAIGTTDIPKGSSVDVTFSRNFTSDRLCTGVEVNGEFHSFGGTTSDVPYAVTFSATVGGLYNIAAVYETDQKDWYVSPTGDNANKGYHKNCPRKTLDKAMELATANKGHIVHAAAGTYDEFAEGADDRSRVVVKEGVGLVADDWPNSETVIVGASDETEDADANGNGPNAVRCVYVNDGGYVRGFKLTGGRSNANGGGAILLGGALVDCEVTGNGCKGSGRAVSSSSQGSIGASDGILIRCYVHDQVSGSYEIYNGTVVDSYARLGSGRVYYGMGMILNSTMLGSQVRSNQKSFRILNSYLTLAMGNSSNWSHCTNCVFTGSPSEAIGSVTDYDEATCHFYADIAENLDENFRPKTAASVLVDAGSKELYDANFPSKWVQFKGRDFKYGQRIYNAQIDVGCGEYDFRPTFAGYLGDRAVISAMGENVTTNDVPNIVVPAGESITLAASPKKPGVSTQYELVYTPDGGEQVVVTEKSTEPFSYKLDGPCVVQSLSAAGVSGFILMIR